VALGDRREDYASGQLRRHVLEGVDGEVYLPREQGLVDLAGKDVAPVYDRKWRLRAVLAGGTDDADLDLQASRAQPLGAGLGLGEGEPGAAGTQ